MIDDPKQPPPDPRKALQERMAKRMAEMSDETFARLLNAIVAPDDIVDEEEDKES